MAHSRDTEVTLQGTFKDSAGTLTSPDEVTLQVLDPAGTLTSYTLGADEVTEESEGVFTRAQVLDKSGPWSYRFKGSPNLKVAGWKRIDVLDDPFD